MHYINILGLLGICYIFISNSSLSAMSNANPNQQQTTKPKIFIEYGMLGKIKYDPNNNTLTEGGIIEPIRPCDPEDSEDPEFILAQNLAKTKLKQKVCSECIKISVVGSCVILTSLAVFLYFFH